MRPGGPLTKDGGGYAERSWGFTPNNHGGIRLAERGYTRRSGLSYSKTYAIDFCTYDFQHFLRI